MAKKTRRKKRVKIRGVYIRRGKQIPTGKGWRLLRPGQKRGFKVSVLKVFRAGNAKLAIVRVLELGRGRR